MNKINLNAKNFHKRGIHDDQQAHIYYIYTRFHIYIKVDEDIALNECKIFMNIYERRAAEGGGASGGGRRAEAKGARTCANGKQTCIQYFLFFSFFFFIFRKRIVEFWKT